MRTAFISVMALASTFIGVMSAPSAISAEHAVEIKRQSTFDAESLITDLSSTLQPSIDSIEATTASVDSSSSTEELAAAQSSITADIATMVAAVNAATAQVPTSVSKLRRRQTDTTTVATEIVDLLETLSTAVNAITADLGLTTTLSILSPLTSALSNLLLALEVVVDDLLAVVEELVDSLLTGLAAGLAGLTL